jgi:outer membrane protein insertion porin family
MNKEIFTPKHFFKTSTVLSALLVLSFSTGVQAITPFKIRDIQVKGLNQVDLSTVLTYLPVKVGDTANDVLINNSIQSLFGTGLFSEVDIQSIDNVLQLKLLERPFIASVSFVGAKEFDKAELISIAKNAGVVEGRMFDKAMLIKLENDLKAAYLSRSKYGVKIDSVTNISDKNKINIVLNFVEGSSAKFKEINILGLKSFSKKQILAEMESTQPHFMSWLTKSDLFSKEKINTDLDNIRAFYLRHGFLEFSIDSNQISLSPDKQDVFLTLIINEGQQFNLQNITFKGGTPEQQTLLQSLVTIEKGVLFNGDTFNSLLSKMQSKLGELGFANAQINPVPKLDYEKQTVDFEIEIDPKEKTYVRKINIVGNTKTRDEVIRREMRQIEATFYDANKIVQSRDRIDRLGFFKEVNIGWVPVENAPEQVDLTVQVVEKSTGNINFGVGFNSTDKASINAGIAQDNLFGSGKNLNFNINSAKKNRSIYLSATDPYFTNSGISRTVEAYSRFNTLQQSGVDRVTIRTNGASVRMGMPVGEVDALFVALGAEYTGVKTFENAPPRYIDFEKNIKGSATYPLLTLSWIRDSRDSALSPTKGSLIKASLETSFGKEVSFAKAGYQYQTFYPINKYFTLAFNLDTGYGRGLEGKTFPFFKNYFVGGVGSVRGYEGNTLGSLDTNGDYIGGASKVVMNTEILFPVPGAVKSKEVRLFTFVDAGYAWAENQRIYTKDLRWSGGVGLNWLSPIGALKFSYGTPFKKTEQDKIQKFQFQIGTGF